MPAASPNFLWSYGRQAGRNPNFLGPTSTFRPNFFAANAAKKIWPQYQLSGVLVRNVLFGLHVVGVLGEVCNTTVLDDLLVESILLAFGAVGLKHAAISPGLLGLAAN